MRGLFYFAGIVALIGWGLVALVGSVSTAESTTWVGHSTEIADHGYSGLARIDTANGSIYLDLDANGTAVIVTGDIKLKNDSGKGSFSSYGDTHSTRVSQRLQHLREFNAPPPPPPVPDTVVIVNQTTSVTTNARRSGRGVGRDGYRRGEHLRPRRHN